MIDPSTFNILMYSHDTYGLGHIRRTMAIAAQLRRPNVNILILTGSPIVGRFDIPEQIDFVRVPGMIKQANDQYIPYTIKIDPEHALQIRQSIIRATAKAFKPQLFIVDKAPRGLNSEIMPTLRMLRREAPYCRTVLGLRDIMDDAASTVEDWKSKDIYSVLDKYYSEIWVYGDQKLYDPIIEYQIPEHISKKIVFTGYIPRLAKHGTDMRKEQHVNCKERLVVVTTGGGGDGYAVLDTYLRMLEETPPTMPMRTVMVSGPFMAKSERVAVACRAKKLGVKFYHFSRQMENFIAAADLVVSMGGYNTVCEILSQHKVSLIIPRETPRREQRIRAEVMKKHSLMDFIPWNDLSPERMRDKLEELLNNIEPCRSAVNDFALSGLEVMRERLAKFQAEQQ
ncbi:Glycosyltransferase 28 domain-containing protein [Desulfovibrio sp. X2]|uniref:glycosyltransferase family protein n=1 Tax=Desulfovibrio sp. X2 TaxID=941449 RepID=UPI000358784A|nr:glycosyltransferase [Desulfovibrio sp. X2]EPR44121.1 Glycosyltransferase 28 domain-containing protein [Desulfovibrio sp. X2]